MPRNHPEYALYSGYEISREDFQAFIWSVKLTLQELTRGYDKDEVFDMSLSAYNIWAHRDEGIPRSIYLYDESPLVEKDVDFPTKNVTSILFPVRFISYTGEEQLKDKNVMESISTENKEDHTALESFLEKVKSENGELDPSKLKFGWVKETHPRRLGYW